MGAIFDAFKSAWRDYNTDGVPASGIYEPLKLPIRDIGATLESELDDIRALRSAGAVAFVTKAAMDADLSYPAHTEGHVWNDGTPANNGVYIKSGAAGAGSWGSKVSDLSTTELDARLDVVEAAYVKKDGTVAYTGNQSMGGHKLTNVAAPTAGPDATNKAYVDAAVGDVGFQSGTSTQYQKYERLFYQRQTQEAMIRSGFAPTFPISMGGKVWAVPIDPATDFRCAAILVPAIVPSTLSYFEGRLTRRLKSAPSTSGPGAAVDDLEVFRITPLPAGQAGVDANKTFVQMPRFDLDGLQLTRDYSYIFQYAGYNASNELVAIGAANATLLETDVPSYWQGWVSGTGFGGPWTLLSPAQPLAVIVIEEARRPAFLGPLPADDVIVESAVGISSIGSPQSYCRTLVTESTTEPKAFQSNNGHSVVIPEMIIRRPSGPLRVKQQTVVLSPLGTSSIVDGPSTLNSNSGSGNTFPAFFLTHRYGFNFTVTRHDTGAVLTPLLDYRLEPEIGWAIGLAGGAADYTPHPAAPNPYLVDISYTAGLSRDDTIFLDKLSGVVDVATGVGRLLDPEEYRPTAPDPYSAGVTYAKNRIVSYAGVAYLSLADGNVGHTPSALGAWWQVAQVTELYAVHCFIPEGGFCAELIPTHEWRNGVRIGEEDKQQRWINSFRARTPKLFSKLANNKPVIWGIYTDSNGGGGLLQYTRQILTDEPDFYKQRVGIYDTIDALNAVHGYTEDGEPRIAINMQHYMQAAMASVSESELVFRNFSIPGTTSASIAYGGSDPLRIAGVQAGGLDFVVVNFGMNDAKYEEVYAIVKAFQDYGVEVAISGVPGWNLYFGTLNVWRTLQQRQQCNEMLQAVADARNCAFIPADLFDLGNEGSTGISLRQHGQLDTTNHPGPSERKFNGRDRWAAPFLPAPNLVPAKLPLHREPPPKPGEMVWRVRPNSSVDLEGLGATASGTESAIAPASTSLYTQEPRRRYTSAGVANSPCGLNGDQLVVFRGNAAGLGGFELLMRFGIAAWGAGARGFFGLRDSTAVIGNVNPSTLTNCLGVGFDDADTNLKLFFNNAAGAALVDNLGARYPVNANATYFYDLRLKAEANASKVLVHLTRLDNAAADTYTRMVDTALGDELPVSTTLLTPHIWMSGNAVAVDVMRRLRLAAG
jgi:hypothetical protein